MKRKLRLSEASRECGIGQEVITRYIRLEWIAPAEAEAPESPPALDDEDLARARLIHELQADMGVNDEAVPIILHLIDQLHLLRRTLRNAS